MSSKIKYPNDLLYLLDKIKTIGKKQSLILIVGIVFGYYVESQIKDIRRRQDDLEEELRRSQEE